MIISISTVVTSSLVGSFLLFLLCVFMGRKKTISRVGPGFVIGVWLVASVRMFFPIEWGYTYSIYFEKVFTTIREFLKYRIIVGEKGPEIWKLLLMIWFLGSLFLGIYKIRCYKRSSRMLHILPEISRERLKGIWTEEFVKKYPEVERLKFVEFDHTVSPFLAGVKHPVVVLPEREFTDQELIYIVGHEVMHYRNHDIFWKILTEVLCTIYWWNPVFAFMEKRLFQMIEIKNDRELTKEMNTKEKSGYLDCLMSIVRDACGITPVGTVGFSKNDRKMLMQRVEFIVSPGKQKKMSQIATGIVVAVLLFLSTAVVFEPTYPIPDTPGDGLELTEDTGYLVENGDVYDIYLLGIHVDTTKKGEDMHPYRGLNRYKTLEEAKEKEKDKYEHYEEYESKLYVTSD